MATGTNTTKRPIVVSSYGITDVGLKRPHNEDSLLVKDDLGLYVVADGMGGHAKGEVASAKAISVMRDFVARCDSDDEFTWPYGIDPDLTELENTIVTSVKLANREVWRISQEREDHQGMGTTIVSMRITGYDVAFAHVGDSRAYRLHKGELLPMTEDHSWVNEQVKKGILSPEDAKDHRWKNVITRALGNKEQVDVDVSRHTMEPGDVLLLCSDGLCAGDELPENDIRDAMIEHQDKLPDLGKILIHMANTASGKDNITVVVVKFHESEDDAASAKRDLSTEDTNPVIQVPGAAGKPEGLDLSSTAEMSTGDITGESPVVDEDDEIDAHDASSNGEHSGAAGLDLNEDETPPATDVSGLVDDDGIFEEAATGEAPVVEEDDDESKKD